MTDHELGQLQIRIAELGQERESLESQLRAEDFKLKENSQMMTSQPMAAQAIEMFQTLKKLKSEIEQRLVKSELLGRKLAGRAENLKKLQ